MANDKGKEEEGDTCSNKCPWGGLTIVDVRFSVLLSDIISAENNSYRCVYALYKLYVLDFYGTAVIKSGSCGEIVEWGRGILRSNFLVFSSTFENR